MKSLKYPIISFVILALLGFIFDLTLNAYIQLSIIYVLVNTIQAMSLNLVNGYTGQFSLGHAGFMAIGAYFSAFLSSQFTIPSGIASLFYFAGFAGLAGALAAIAGYIVGLPSLRLKGDYLAIVTLGFGEIIRVLILNTPQLGGARGMYGIPGTQDIWIGTFQLSKFFVGYSHAIFWVLVTYFVIWRLVHSTHGRAFMSVREDEIASESVGVDTTQTKVRAFVLSSFFAGVAGSIFAHYSNYLNPSTFSLVMSINAVIMVVLGGMGSMTGPILAAIIVTVLPELLRPLQEVTGKDLRMVIYALILILLMLLRPQGLFGQKEIHELSWIQKLFKRKSSEAST